MPRLANGAGVVATEQFSSSAIAHATEEWRAVIAVHPEVGMPGYWQALEENCADWARVVSVSRFWKECDQRRIEWSNEFHRMSGGPLLARDDLPDFCGKEHERIKSKIVQLVAQDASVLSQKYRSVFGLEPRASARAVRPHGMNTAAPICRSFNETLH